MTDERREGEIAALERVVDGLDGGGFFRDRNTLEGLLARLRGEGGEPVAWDVFSVYEGGLAYEYTISRHAEDWERRVEFARTEYERVVPLYTAPPAPVGGEGTHCVVSRADVLRENEALRFWNESVSVCSKHTKEIVSPDVECYVCALEGRSPDVLREALEEIRDATRPDRIWNVHESSPDLTEKVYTIARAALSTEGEG